MSRGGKNYICKSNIVTTLVVLAVTTVMIFLALLVRGDSNERREACENAFFLGEQLTALEASSHSLTLDIWYSDRVGDEESVDFGNAGLETNKEQETVMRPMYQDAKEECLSNF